MGKFEKGQYVRCVGANDTELLTVGKVYKVDAVNGGYIDVELDNGSVGGMWSHRFEVWQPKVGDRVRFTDATPSHWFFGPTKDQKDGVISSIDGSSFIVEMGEDTGYVDIKHIEPMTKAVAAVPLALEVGKRFLSRDGTTVSIVQAYDGDSYDFVGEIEGVVGNKVYKKDGKHGSKYIGNVPEYDLIAELPSLTTLTIEVGKTYRTRDGRKVGPVESCGYYFTVDGWHYNASGECGFEGRHHPEDDWRDKHDLIAEWVDEPAAQPAKASNDNAEPTKPKFKVGDRVKTKGWARFYEIAEVEGTDIHVILYDGTTSKEYTEGREFEFELTTPAIVALIENGTAKPATRPKVHADQSSAATEAERLALQFPGQQFGVFVLADSKIADVVNVPTAVLRAA